jgi:hypothetical protein
LIRTPPLSPWITADPAPAGGLISWAAVGMTDSPALRMAKSTNNWRKRPERLDMMDLLVDYDINIRNLNIE